MQSRCQSRREKLHWSSPSLNANHSVGCVFGSGLSGSSRPDVSFEPNRWSRARPSSAIVSSGHPLRETSIRVERSSLLLRSTSHILDSTRFETTMSVSNSPQSLPPATASAKLNSSGGEASSAASVAKRCVRVPGSPFPLCAPVLASRTRGGRVRPWAKRASTSGTRSRLREVAPRLALTRRAVSSSRINDQEKGASEHKHHRAASRPARLTCPPHTGSRAS